MRIHLAGLEQGYLTTLYLLHTFSKMNCKNGLVSYFYLMGERYASKIGELEEYFNSPEKRLFLDSGAFTATRKKVKIDLQGYCDFIKEHSKAISIYANFDNIEDWRMTQKNQIEIEKRGLTPLPVWHSGEPLEVLKDYCKQYKYLALGGLVPYSKDIDRLWQILDGAWTVIKEFFPIKIHCFGITRLDTLLRYPFYSADGFSWVSGFRGTYQSLRLNQIVNLPDIKRLEDIRFNTFQECFFESEKAGRTDWRNEQNALTWQKAEKFITELWAERGIVWKN